MYLLTSHVVVDQPRPPAGGATGNGFFGSFGSCWPLNQTRSVPLAAPPLTMCVTLALGLVDDCRKPRSVCVMSPPGGCTKRPSYTTIFVSGCDGSRYTTNSDAPGVSGRHDPAGASGSVTVLRLSPAFSRSASLTIRLPLIFPSASFCSGSARST